jgi:hypothetical protein
MLVLASSTKFILLILVVTTAVEYVLGNNCKGCTALDSLTFDKMINHFRVSLVKIDVPYPYGDKQVRNCSETIAICSFDFEGTLFLAVFNLAKFFTCQGSECFRAKTSPM